MYLSFLVSALLACGFAIAILQQDSQGLSSLSSSSSVDVLSTGDIQNLVPSSTAVISTVLRPSLNLITMIYLAAATSSAPKTVFPTSLTAKLRSLSENDSKVTTTTSNQTQSENLPPALSTQASSEEIGFSTPEQFEAQVLLAHNWYRAAHGADPLVWNDALANTSSDWVVECAWNIQPSSDIGKNYAALIPTSVSVIMNDMGLERQFYNWSDPGLNNSTRQFTQMVWKSTTQLGCAWNNCPPGSSPDTRAPAPSEVSLFLLCQYYPKGNIGTATDWGNNVGEIDSGSLGEGIIAASGLGLSSFTSTNVASTTSRSSAAATGMDSESAGNKLDHNLFAIILGLVVIIGSVTKYPSVLVSLLLISGFTFAIGESKAISSNSIEMLVPLSPFTTTVPIHTSIFAPIETFMHVPTIAALPLSIPASSSTPKFTSTNTAFTSGHNASPSLNTQARPEETGFSSPAEFNTQILLGVNWYQPILNHPDLVWDDTLAGWSTNWDQLNDFYNKTIVGDDYGYTKVAILQDLNSSGVIYNYIISDVINHWGQLVLLCYDVENDGISTGSRDMNNKSDAFTQMIWKDTTHFGCDWNNCPAECEINFGRSWLFVACEYYPKGNTGDAAHWTYNVGPINAQACSQLASGLTESSGLEARSAASTITTTLGQHSKTTAGVATSTNLAYKMDQTSFVVFISSFAIVGGPV